MSKNEKLRLLFFESLSTYEIRELSQNKFISEIEEYLGCKTRCKQSGDPWMNRFPILHKGNSGFVIVPSTFPSNNDIAVATVGRFIIFKAEPSAFLSLTDEDVEYVITELPKLFSKEKREEFATKYKKDVDLSLMCQIYREGLNKLSIDNALFLRELYLENKREYELLFISLVLDDAATEGMVNKIYKNHFDKATENEIKTFYSEIKNSYQYVKTYLEGDFGKVYYLLPCHEKDYKEAFLRASQKEWLETYKNIISKETL